MTRDSDEWGPWIEHDGKGCPCVGLYIQVEGHCLEWGLVMVEEGIMTPKGVPCWNIVHPDFGPVVIRYRIRKPRALRQLRDMVENLPAPERERADT